MENKKKPQCFLQKDTPTRRKDNKNKTDYHSNTSTNSYSYNKRNIMKLTIQQHFVPEIWGAS